MIRKYCLSAIDSIMSLSNIFCFSHHLPRIQSKLLSANAAGESCVNGHSPTVTTTMDIRHDRGAGDIRHCRVMIVCLTPKYFQNEHCLNELRLCEIYQKPVVICLLRHMNQYRSSQALNTSLNLDEQINTFIPPRLPMTTLNFLRKNIRLSCIDLSTNELFSRNGPMLIRRLETVLAKHSTPVASTTNPLDPTAFNQTSEVF